MVDWVQKLVEKVKNKYPLDQDLFYYLVQQYLQISLRYDMANKKRRNIVLGFVLTLCVVVLSALAGSHIIAEKLIADFLEKKIPKHIKLDYEDLDVSVLKGKIQFEKVNLDIYEKDLSLRHTQLKVNVFTIDDFDYWQFFMKKTVEVDEILLDQPHVDHQLHPAPQKKDSVSKGVVDLLKPIVVHKITVNNGGLKLMRNNEEGVKMSTESVNFSMTGAKTGPEIVKRRIPLEYDGFNLDIADVFIDLGPYETLKASALNLNEDQVVIHDMNISSKYSKAELSKKLSVERDHIVLDVPLIEIMDIDFGFRNRIFYVDIGEGTVHEPNLAIYRDKLLPDDLRQKKLYSRMLRELPIQLTWPEVDIQNGKVTYSELVDANANPAPLVFDDLNATLKNVTNHHLNKKEVSIIAKARLMDKAKIELDWSFNHLEENDSFIASGSLHDFRAESINAFLTSNLRAKAQGHVQQMYFTFSGNAVSSQGDMKMKYEDFEFSVLKKDRSGINKLLTTLGHIFINDGSKTAADGYRYGQIEVDRDPTKSFFNYLWLNVRDGTVSTLTGKGHKKMGKDYSEN